MPNGNPNIVVIWGDDVGITNLSCCTRRDRRRRHSPSTRPTRCITDALKSGS